MTCPTKHTPAALKATLERNCDPDPRQDGKCPSYQQRKDPSATMKTPPSEQHPGGGLKKRHDKRINDAARRRGMNIGNLGPHLNTEALDWLAKNKPPEMNIAEYMAKAILPDLSWRRMPSEHAACPLQSSKVHG